MTLNPGQEEIVSKPLKYSVRVTIGLVYDINDLAQLRRYLAERRVTPDDVVTTDSVHYVPVGDLADETDAEFEARLSAATEPPDFED